MQIQTGDQQTMQGPEEASAGDDDDDGDHPIDVVVDDQIDEYRPEERDQRTDREIDAARDDGEGLADREYAEQADLVGGVGEVPRKQEPLVDQLDDGRPENQDQDKQAKVFLEHRRLNPPSGRPRAAGRCVR